MNITDIARWVVQNIREDEQFETMNAMADYLNQYPDYADLPMPRIRDLALGIENVRPAPFVAGIRPVIC